MIIKPLIGIDDFVFGLSEKHIRTQLGTPDLIEEAWGDDDILVYQYNKIKTRFSFYKDQNSKLGYIRSANKNLLINQKKLIGKKISVVTDKILKQCCQNWEIEEFELSQHYYSKELNITLIVQYDKVTDIELGGCFWN